MERPSLIKPFVSVSTVAMRRSEHCASVAKMLKLRPEYVNWSNVPRPGWYVSMPWARVLIALTERDLTAFMAGWKGGAVGPLVEALVHYYPLVYLVPTPDYLLDFDTLATPVATKLHPLVEAETSRGVQATRGLTVYPSKSRGFILLHDSRHGEPTWGVRYDRYGWKLEAQLVKLSKQPSR